MFANNNEKNLDFCVCKRRKKSLRGVCTDRIHQAYSFNVYNLEFI